MCYFISVGEKVGCYKEIYRVLKPGQRFAAYEWCMTDAFDPNNQDHQKIKVVTETTTYNTVFQWPILYAILEDD